MSVLDPQLLFLTESKQDNLPADTAESIVDDLSRSMATVRGKKQPKLQANILVQYAGDIAALTKAGMQITSVSGDVVAGYIAVDKLSTMEGVTGIERIEASRPLHAELDLSVIETRADQVHAGPPGRRGEGVIVGIVDTGCDYTHPCFLATDGSSRILSIWDQTLSPQTGESSPAEFTYGVEYSKSDIDAALASASPLSLVRHQDSGHGTHVAGIAAGDGSVAGQGRPADTFVGVAPEADLIIVAVRGNGSEGFGTSASALDAVNYVYQQARANDKAAVVNMSLGDNLGPHDGTSLLERGLDNLLGENGRAFVKSAGNAGADRIHAQGIAIPSATQTVRFNQPITTRTTNQMDCWYSGSDQFRVSVTDASGITVGPVGVGSVQTLDFPSGNRVRIDHRDNDSINGDKRVFMTFSRGTADRFLVGNWSLKIEALSAPSGGRFDVWIQRSRIPIPEFLSPHESRAITVSTPGSAQEIITVANYSSSGFSTGALVSSSSRGPTRDGRAAPTVAAPGRSVMSARANSAGGEPYVALSGTSMSAPHVAGTIALMLEKNRNQTQAQIKACLENSARTDVNTGPTPNTAWGAGKMDANASVDCVQRFPSIQRSVVLISCQRSIVQLSCNVSVPLILCNSRPSVPLSACPSVIPATCQQSVVTVCRSIPINSCQVQSVPGTLCGGRSVVDGCRSVPAGCGIPGTGFPRGVGEEDEMSYSDGFVPYRQSEHGQPYDDGVQQETGRLQSGDSIEPDHTGSLWDQINVPEQGYHDYDDAWFDSES